MLALKGVEEGNAVYRLRLDDFNTENHIRNRYVGIERHCINSSSIVNRISALFELSLISEGSLVAIV